jgi:hypothetical protein
MFTALGEIAIVYSIQGKPNFGIKVSAEATRLQDLYFFFRIVSSEQ